MLENESSACSCKKKKCPRHGNCAKCIEYHKNPKILYKIQQKN